MATWVQLWLDYISLWVQALGHSEFSVLTWKCQAGLTGPQLSFSEPQGPVRREQVSQEKEISSPVNLGDNACHLTFLAVR